MQDASLSWSGVSLGTIAKRLVATAIAHTGESLPVVLPADVAGISTRTYPGYELAWVGDRLQELTQVDGGPDVSFEPRLTSDGLSVQWVMRTGTDTDPLLHQTGQDWIWDRGAAKGGVTSLSVSIDATGMAQRAWAIGSGTEVDLLVGEADFPDPLDAGYPLLEADASYTSVTDQGTLDAHALSLILYAQRPWATWALAVRADAAPTLGTYRPGDSSSPSERSESRGGRVMPVLRLGSAVLRGLGSAVLRGLVSASLRRPGDRSGRLEGARTGALGGARAAARDAQPTGLAHEQPRDPVGAHVRVDLLGRTHRP